MPTHQHRRVALVGLTRHVADRPRAPGHLARLCIRPAARRRSASRRNHHARRRRSSTWRPAGGPLVCPLDGHDAAPATRPEASAPAAAAHGICPTRADSLRFCQNFQNQWVALVEVAAERLRAGRCQLVAKNGAPRGTTRHSDPIKTPQFARIQPDGGRGAV